MTEPKKYIDLKCPKCGKVTHFEKDAEEFICECGRDLGRIYDIVDLFDDVEKIRAERRAEQKPKQQRHWPF